MKLLGISGSLTPHSRTAEVVRLALAEAAQAHADVEAEMLDLRTADLVFCDGRPVPDYPAPTREVIARVEGADALLVATPMYRGSYTGALKNLFDLVRNEPMAGKVVGLIATGGSDHHFLALEHQLRPLFGFFRCHTVPGAVYVQNAHFAGAQLQDAQVLEAVRRLALETVALWRGLAQSGAGPRDPATARKEGEG